MNQNVWCQLVDTAGQPFFGCSVTEIIHPRTSTISQYLSALKDSEDGVLLEHCETESLKVFKDMESFKGNQLLSQESLLDDLGCASDKPIIIEVPHPQNIDTVINRMYQSLVAMKRKHEQRLADLERFGKEKVKETEENCRLKRKHKNEIEDIESVTRKRDIETRSFIGWLLSDGLPDLKFGTMKSSSSSYETLQKPFPFTCDNGDIEVAIIKDLKTFDVCSVLWLSSYERRCWGETEIRQRIQACLHDCISTISLKERTGAFSSVLFYGIDIHKPDQTDVCIGVRDTPYAIVGAVNVKKPPTEAQRKKGQEFDTNEIGQLVQYLYDLRAVHGVRFVFGILTTYEKWRFVWFEDSNEAIQCDNQDDFAKLCEKSSTTTSFQSPVAPNINVAVIPTELKVVKSKVYTADDPKLIPTLLTLCYKWEKTPRDAVLGYLHPNRVYPVAQFGSDDYSIEKLPQSLKEFSYVFPFSEDTDRLYFLHVNQMSGDGKVALWTTGDGNIGVAKFIKISTANDTTNRLSAQQEAALWKLLWDVDAKVVKMVKADVILMPFVFCIRCYADKLQFFPMSAWNHKLDPEIALHDLDKVIEDDLLKVSDEVNELNQNPLKIAHEALSQMILQKGWKLDDDEVDWRHIGLLPWPKGQSWTMKPVVIDLTRVEEVPVEERQFVFERHLSILKDLMP